MVAITPAYKISQFIFVMEIRQYMWKSVTQLCGQQLNRNSDDGFYNTTPYDTTDPQNGGKCERTLGKREAI